MLFIFGLYELLSCEEVYLHANKFISKLGFRRNKIFISLDYVYFISFSSEHTFGVNAEKIFKEF